MSASAGAWNPPARSFAAHPFIKKVGTRFIFMIVRYAIRTAMKTVQILTGRRFALR